MMTVSDIHTGDCLFEFYEKIHMNQVLPIHCPLDKKMVNMLIPNFSIRSMTEQVIFKSYLVIIFILRLQLELVLIEN